MNEPSPDTDHCAASLRVNRSPAPRSFVRERSAGAVFRGIVTRGQPDLPGGPRDERSKPYSPTRIYPRTGIGRAWRTDHAHPGFSRNIRSPPDAMQVVRCIRSPRRCVCSTGTSDSRDPGQRGVKPMTGQRADFENAYAGRLRPAGGRGTGPGPRGRAPGSMSGCR